MTVLATARLSLVPFTDDHVDGLNTLNSDPEVMRYLSGRPETRDDTVGWSNGSSDAGSRSGIRGGA